jgi:hypothetical protein
MAINQSLSELTCLYRSGGEEQADKAYVVVDDEFGIPEEMAPLFDPLWNQLTPHGKVAFFKIDSPGTDHDCLHALVSEIVQWCESEARGMVLFFLIDWMFGNQRHEDVAPGPFIWHEIERHFGDARMAWFSRTVPREENRPREEQRFVKPNFESSLDTGVLPIEFKTWACIAPSQASALWETATIWDEFRWTAHKLMFDERPDVRPDGDWAHHLPGGNQPLSFYDVPFKVVKDRLTRHWPQISDFPDFRWGEKGEDTWEQPPLRALLQFDGLGEGRTGDLSKALDRLRVSLEVAAQDEVSGTRLCYIDWRMEEVNYEHMVWDWLWFNVFAVGRGLVRLVKQFCSVVEEHYAGHVGDSLFSVKLEICGNENMENADAPPAELDFSATISQRVGNAKTGKPLPFPNPFGCSSADNLGRVYEILENAGAELIVEEGALIITVKCSYDAEAAIAHLMPFYRTRLL